MRTNLLQTSSLLEYNADHRVLICRECQHAIQKSAIDRHLLKHKVYRKRRQDLLDEIARLELIEAEAVAQPSPGSKPIKSLSIYQGYRCAVMDCQYLTISDKRMKCHLNQIHGLGVTVVSLRELAYTVSLQTFFRGAKVRYFEVLPIADRSLVDGQNESAPRHAQRTDTYRGIPLSAGATMRSSALLGRVQVLRPSPGSDTPASVQLDLTALQYFHHFLCVTILTLPGPSEYWQTKASSEALGQNSTMCGVLAISAYHLAFLTTDSLAKCRYSRDHALFLSEFTSTHDTGLRQTKPTAFIDQLACVFRCAQWSAAPTLSNCAVYDGLRLDALLDGIRGYVVPEKTNPILATVSGQDRSREADASRDDVCLSRDQCTSEQLNYVRTLPLRMAECLEKPSSNQDFFATMSALNALTECCEVISTSNDIETLWRGVSAWVVSISDRFRTMLVRSDPAAMIVLAHWAATLLRRAEHGGCWFLEGAASKIVRHVVSQLAAYHLHLLPLVSCLLKHIGD